MDAADRAELERLRRRAFDRAPDIFADAAALARLIALEDLARQELVLSSPPVDAPGNGIPAAPEEAQAHAEAAEEPPVTSPAAASGHDAAPASAADAGASAARRAAVPPPRRALAVLAIGFAVVVGVASWAVTATVPPPAAVPTPTPTRTPPEGREAYSFARDDSALSLLQVRLDGSFGRYIELPSEAYVPEFPTSGQIDWAYPLGEYYGWDLWIAGGPGLIQREHCILVERGPVRRARCVPAVLRPNAALLVSVPYTEVAPAERPLALDPNERLGFWWHDDDAVDILVGAQFSG